MQKPNVETLKILVSDLSWEVFDEIQIFPDPYVQNTALALNLTKKKAGLVYSSDHSAEEVDYVAATKQIARNA